MSEDLRTKRKPKRTSLDLWRWRSNPLRRRDDVMEAWLLLAMWALIVVGGTLAGVVIARAADEEFALQRAERTPVRAVLLTDVPRTASTDSGVGTGMALAKVRWTAPDGSTRTDKTLVDTGQKAGTRITVWTDGQERLSPEPSTPTEAAVEAGVLGAAAALALGGAVFAAGRTARWGLDRRRIKQWGREWDLVGPQWGH
ncbi:hypothetical protein FNH04_04020, partial [Streptomyces phyllanthi]